MRAKPLDVVVLPLDVGRRRSDRDPALAFELHVVHGRADPVLTLDVVDRMDPLGVEQDPLGQRRLARVDVGRDLDVSDAVDVLDPEVAGLEAVAEEQTLRVEDPEVVDRAATPDQDALAGPDRRVDTGPRA